MKKILFLFAMMTVGVSSAIIVEDIDTPPANIHRGFYERALRDAIINTPLNDYQISFKDRAQMAKQMAEYSRFEARRQYMDNSMPIIPGLLGPQETMHQAAEYDRAAAFWDYIDQREIIYFEEMRSASRRERSQKFINARDSLRKEINALRSTLWYPHDFFEINKVYLSYLLKRRAIVTFRGSIDPKLGIENWIRTQDAEFARIYNEHGSAMREVYDGLKMRMSSYTPAPPEKSYNISSSCEALGGGLFKMRCFQCNKEYTAMVGMSGCPQCTAPNYDGRGTYLADDPDHPGEKIRKPLPSPW